MPYHTTAYKPKTKTTIFKVHKMYKGNMVKTAKTMAEHKRLMKMGYSNRKPKTKKRQKK